MLSCMRYPAFLPEIFQMKPNAWPGAPLAQVNFSNIDSMMNRGLHNSIDELQKKLVEVGQSVFETLVLPSL